MELNLFLQKIVLSMKTYPVCELLRMLSLFRVQKLELERFLYGQPPYDPMHDFFSKLNRALFAVGRDDWIQSDRIMTTVSHRIISAPLDNSHPL